MFNFYSNWQTLNYINIKYIKQIKTKFNKRMPDYSKSKIYTIRFNDNSKLIYIGSTIQTLSVRYGGHKKNIGCSLYEYVQKNYNGEWSNTYIELLEYCECNDKNELNKKEGEIIRKFKADENYLVINKRIEGRTTKQYRQDNADKIKEYQKQYLLDNPEVNIRAVLKYRAKNIDKYNHYQNELMKKKRDEDREAYNEKQKKYNKIYRERIKKEKAEAKKKQEDINDKQNK